jgi:hypothetical protein
MNKIPWPTKTDNQKRPPHNANLLLGKLQWITRF